MHAQIIILVPISIIAVLFSWMVDSGGISAEILAKVLGHVLPKYTQVCTYRFAWSYSEFEEVHEPPDSN